MRAAEAQRSSRRGQGPSPGWQDAERLRLYKEHIRQGGSVSMPNDAVNEHLRMREAAKRLTSLLDREIWEAEAGGRSDLFPRAEGEAEAELQHAVSLGEWSAVEAELEQLKKEMWGDAIIRRQDWQEWHAHFDGISVDPNEAAFRASMRTLDDEIRAREFPIAPLPPVPPSVPPMWRTPPRLRTRVPQAPISYSVDEWSRETASMTMPPSRSSVQISTTPPSASSATPATPATPVSSSSRSSGEANHTQHGTLHMAWALASTWHAMGVW